MKQEDKNIVAITSIDNVCNTLLYFEYHHDQIGLRFRPTADAGLFVFQRLFKTVDTDYVARKFAKQF